MGGLGADFSMLARFAALASGWIFNLRSWVYSLDFTSIIALNPTLTLVLGKMVPRWAFSVPALMIPLSVWPYMFMTT